MNWMMVCSELDEGLQQKGFGRGPAVNWEMVSSELVLLNISMSIVSCSMSFYKNVLPDTLSEKLEYLFFSLGYFCAIS